MQYENEYEFAGLVLPDHLVEFGADLVTVVRLVSKFIVNEKLDTETYLGVKYYITTYVTRSGKTVDKVEEIGGLHKSKSLDKIYEQHKEKIEAKLWRQS